MSFLLDHYYTKEADHYKFLAAINGIDLDDVKGNKEGSTSNHVSPKSSNKSKLLFGDPADYENYSDKEREDLTKQMLAKHKTWAKKGRPN